MKNNRNIIFIILFILSIIFLNCSGNTDKKALVTFNSGIKKRSLTRAPADITSLSITVTADNSTIFNQSYTSSEYFDSITIELEPGGNRTFTLTAGGGSVSYSGSATANIYPGRNKVAIALDIVPETFNVVSDPGPSYNDQPRAVTIDNNYIYIAGYYSTGTFVNDRRWRIEKRDKRDGSLVTAFGQPLGTNGYVVSATTQAEAYDIAVDGNDLYIVGYSYDKIYSVAVWRIEKRDATTGVLDTNFNGTGIITYNVDPVGYATDEAWTIAYDSTYLYIGGGEYDGNTNYDARIEKRFKSDGSLETANFNSPNGYFLFNSNSNGYGYTSTACSLAVDSNYIYAGGNYYDSTNNDYERTINRFNILSGAIDGSWITVTDNGNDDEFFTIALDSNSNIFLGGYITDGSYFRQWQLEKYDINSAAPDTNFGSSGVVQSTYAVNTRNRVNSIAVDSEYVYSAGYYDYDGESTTRWRLEKREKNSGVLDPEFSNSGVFTLNTINGDEAITDIAVDQYYIYIVGSDYSLPVPGDTQWRIIKMVKRDGSY